MNKLSPSILLLACLSIVLIVAAACYPPAPHSSAADRRSRHLQPGAGHDGLQPWRVRRCVGFSRPAYTSNTLAASRAASTGQSV